MVEKVLHFGITRIHRVTKRRAERAFYAGKYVFLCPFKTWDSTFLEKDLLPTSKNLALHGNFKDEINIFKKRSCKESYLLSVSYFIDDPFF